MLINLCKQAISLLKNKPHQTDKNLISNKYFKEINTFEKKYS